MCKFLPARESNLFVCSAHVHLQTSSFFHLICKLRFWSENVNKNDSNLIELNECCPMLPNVTSGNICQSVSKSHTTKI